MSKIIPPEPADILCISEYAEYVLVLVWFVKIDVPSFLYKWFLIIIRRRIWKLLQYFYLNTLDNILATLTIQILQLTIIHTVLAF